MLTRGTRPTTGQDPTPLERLARSHRCQSCGDGSTLTVRWNGEMSQYEAWCPRCGNRDRFERRKSLRQLYREGAALPIAIVNRFQKADQTEVNEVAAERRKQIQQTVTEMRWNWEGFCAKFQQAYKVALEDATVEQLDEALDKIRAALKAKRSGRPAEEGGSA